MIMPKVGMRVGAMASKNNGTILLFGYGTYMGDEVPPNEGGGSMTTLLNGLRVENPKIILDNGDVVWGCECWWSTEKEMQAMISGENLAVIDLAIADFRTGKFPHVIAPAETDDFWTA